MRRPGPGSVVVCAVALLAAAPTHAAPDVQPVAIEYASFAPDRVDVLAGDTVTWTNTSGRDHTVTADGFDSGRLPPRVQFTQRFETSGSFAYRCTLHRFMLGEVDVHPVLLRGPSGVLRRGTPFVLAGRAMPSILRLTIEADRGRGRRRVATVTPAADGSFSVRLRATASASYRAVDGSRTSLGVRVRVEGRRVRLVAVRRGDGVVLRSHVVPAAPGATVVLQLRLRERFGWWPVRRARLDRRSSARFAFRRRPNAPARAVLTLPDGTTPLAYSAAVHLGYARSGVPHRVARDQARIARAVRARPGPVGPRRHARVWAASRSRGAGQRAATWRR